MKSNKKKDAILLHHEIIRNGVSKTAEDAPLVDEMPVVVMLHGLLGSSGNWRSFARVLSDSFNVVLFDLRNHGQSAHAMTMSYPEFALDVVSMLEKLGIQRAHVVGHSMGGKVAFALAHYYPDFVQTLIVLDIAPTAYPLRLSPTIDRLRQLPLDSIRSRKEAGQFLLPYIQSEQSRAFLLQNLILVNGRYRWRCNLDSLRDNMKNLAAAVPLSVSSMPLLLLYGEQSDYVSKSQRIAVTKLFPNGSVTGVPEAGHLLHLDQPALVMRLIRDHLTSSRHYLSTQRAVSL